MFHSACGDAAAHQCSAADASDESMTPVRRRARVLIVDDNRDFAEVLVILLRSLRLDVRAAFDAGSALALADHFTPDVILLELGLPETDAFQLAASLRSKALPERPRLVALTAWMREGDRERTFEAGFAAHLLKPVSLKDLAKFLV